MIFLNGSLDGAIVMPGLAERAMAEIAEISHKYQVLNASPGKQGWFSRMIGKLRT